MGSSSIILVGSGGHAGACIDVVEQESIFDVAGLVGLAHEVGSRILGYPVLGTDADLSSIIESAPNALIVVGQINTPVSRIRLFEMLTQMGFKMPVIISPLAYVSRHSKIAEGTIIMHGATVNAGAKVGKNCIINSHALIEHDVSIGDHCHISTGAVLNGNVKIGEGSFIGSRSVIKEGVSLGEYCLVGMGLSIRHDQPDRAQTTCNS